VSDVSLIKIHSHKLRNSPKQRTKTVPASGPPS
jgi:hypothetical protein